MADRIVIELDREEVEALITGNSPHFERAAKKLRAALALASESGEEPVCKACGDGRYAPECQWCHRDDESVTWSEDMSGMKADAVVPESGEGEDWPAEIYLVADKDGDVVEGWRFAPPYGFASRRYIPAPEGSDDA